MNLSIPMLQIRSKAAVFYYEYQGKPSKSLQAKRAQNLQTQRLTRYSGTVTTGVKKRMAKCITLLVQMARPTKIYNPVTDRTQSHRLSFITLTIPARENLLTARQAYDIIFKDFLQWMRRTEKAKTYVWKAELQARGQIHYHITTPTFIHYQTLRDKWNNLLRQNDLMSEYKREYNSENPNSTDIHEVRHVKDLTSYMVKEFCKTVQNETPTTGKLWDASQNLKESKYFTIEFGNQHRAYLDRLQEQKICERFDGEQYSIFKMSDSNLINLMSKDEKNEFADFLAKLRRHEQKTIFEECKVIQMPGVKKDKNTVETEAEKQYKKLGAAGWL